MIFTEVKRERFNELAEQGKLETIEIALVNGLAFYCKEEEAEVTDTTEPNVEDVKGEVIPTVDPTGDITEGNVVGNINKVLEFIKDKETIFKKELVEGLSIADIEAKAIIATLVEQGKLVKPNHNTKPYTVVKEAE